jgi:hypothetical protein
MNNRERAMAILNYQDYDRLPIVHFGFWSGVTLQRWAAEGHLSLAEAEGWSDGNPIDTLISQKLGFDFNWYRCFHPRTQLFPPFEPQLVEELPDGSRKILNDEGVIVLQREGATSIPAEIDHLFKGRQAWEDLYRPRLQFSQARIDRARVNIGAEEIRYDQGGLAFLQRGEWDTPYGLHCGSLFGVIRNWLGLVGVSYLQVDDPDLFSEIIDTVGELCYRCTQTVLESEARFDFAHFWEDISFKSGPLINPRVFRAQVGPHYQRITDLVRSYGIEIVSVDSDGKIDHLLPIWLEHGVNTMFPIEVGTWEASIAPWREKYGRVLRGVGGVNKKVFARDYAAIDAEIERLKPLVELGGYIPCPDHRLAPDARWENVQYYTEQMRKTFG